MATTKEEPQTRVMIWAVPRSASNAMLRAMSNKIGTKCLHEPYCDAYYFGSERTSWTYCGRAGYAEQIKNRAYQDIRDRLELPYTGFQTVVSKDQAYYLGHEKANMISRLPAGYVHSFIMRHPAKTISSLYKRLSSTGEDFEPKEAGFRELLALYELVTEELGQHAVVMDMDDLLQQPEPMMKLYCEKVGMTYEDAMVHWDSDREDLGLFTGWQPVWYESLLKSNTFQKPGEQRKPTEPDDLPEIVQKTIQDSLPYYNTLYENRLTL